MVRLDNIFTLRETSFDFIVRAVNAKAFRANSLRQTAPHPSAVRARGTGKYMVLQSDRQVRDVSPFESYVG